MDVTPRQALLAYYDAILELFMHWQLDVNRFASLREAGAGDVALRAVLDQLEAVTDQADSLAIPPEAELLHHTFAMMLAYGLDWHSLRLATVTETLLMPAARAYSDSLALFNAECSRFITLTRKAPESA